MLPSTEKFSEQNNTPTNFPQVCQGSFIYFSAAFYSSFTGDGEVLAAS